MTLYEVLKFYREPYLRLLNLGVSTSDFRFIDLYTDYLAMKGSGCKVTYIVALLAERYGICERRVYKILRRFGRDCTGGAAQSP